MKSLCLVSVLIPVQMVIGAATDKLQFNKDGKFKFVQFTDIHLAEGPDTDLAAQNLMRKVLDLEKPDFVVSTGDIISGYAWDGVT